jgi:hypothetical protein
MGDEKHNSVPEVKIDFGLSAKASLEVKTELPKEVMGDVVRSVLDMFAPFIEGRRLKADIVRLQREDVVCKIARKARKRAEIEGVTLNPVPTKLLIPFMEKASMEDVDVSMLDSWAALLLSASQSYKAVHLTFVDITSRLSSDELRLMEKICFDYQAFPEASYPTGHADHNKDNVIASIHLLEHIPGGSEKKAHEAFASAATLIYGNLIFDAVTRVDGARVYFYHGYSGLNQSASASLDVLEREQLISRRIVNNASGAPVAGYFEATNLGITFVRECSPDATKMAARRPPPVRAREVSPSEAASIMAAFGAKGD